MTQPSFGRSPEQRYQQLYNLLPAIYRVRDAEQGRPLQALLAILERELQGVEADIEGLYDNWFIETCDEWVVPYIGDLLNVRELYAQSSRTYGQQERRAYVGNTLAYRRRKGTVPVLEQLVQDVTGWRSRAVEFFQFLATTQNINHERPKNTTVDLRSGKQPDRLGTPFESQAAYTVEVRSIQNTRDRGRYNISNIGLFIWRLQSYPIQGGTARLVAQPELQPKGRHYTFSPLGLDIPLFNLPRTDTDIIRVAEEIQLPAQLRPEALIEELKARAEQKPLPDESYFGGEPVFQIFVDAQAQPILPTEILITRLGQESVEATTNTSQSKNSQRSQVLKNWQLPRLENDTPYRVAVDPELGRLVFLKETPTSVKVNYAYGFSGEIGGGPYDRSESLAKATPQGVSHISWVVNPDPSVEQTSTNNVVRSCTEAVNRWNAIVQIWQFCQEQIFIPLARLTVDADGNLSSLSSQSPLGNSVSGSAESRTNLGRDHFPVVAPNLDGVATGALPPVIALHPDAVGADSGGTQALPPQNFSTLQQRPLAPRCQPGILEGLSVTAKPGATKATVTQGIAIDAQGRRLQLPIKYRVNLRRLNLGDAQSHILWLVLTYPNDGTSQSQIEAVSDAAADPANREHVRLACLTVNSWGQILKAEANLCPKFQPGIIEGLQVHSSSSTQIRVTPGVAVNSQGKRIELEATQTFNLGSYPSQTFTLFLAPKASREWQQVDLVPEVDLGVIMVKSNRTYRGHLHINIPADKQLHLIAANGDRPHLLGNLSIRGIAPKDSNPGEFTVDGLLIEGQLTVRSGNLKHLWMSHCTLVPQSGEIVVEPPPSGEDDEVEGDESLTLIAIVLYWLNLIRRLVSLGTDTSQRPPSQIVYQLIMMGLQQATYLLSCVRSAIPSGLCLPGTQDDSETGDRESLATPSELALLQSAVDNLQEVEAQDSRELFSRAKSGVQQDNPNLTVSIGRSITGPLQLPDTVPYLEIVDSIIDKGGDQRLKANSEEILEDAIAAPNTNTDIQTTTVLGCTRVRSLEASNSIFMDKVTALRQQVGCVRFSHVPVGSKTPRRYLCQPDHVFAETLDNLPAAITAIAIAPNSGETFAATAGNGIFRASAPGQAWISVKQGLTDLNIIALVALPTAQTPQSHLLAGTASGRIFYSEDSGNQWQSISAVSTVNAGYSNSAITAFGVNNVLKTQTASSQEIPTLFVGTAGSGIFRSSDMGHTWEFANNGMTNLNITALAVNHLGQVVAGTAGGGIFYSNDNGRSWNSLNVGLTDGEVTALTTDQRGQLFVGTANRGVFRFNADGQLWCSINKGLSDWQVTALAAYTRPVTGTISSQGTTVRGDENTDFRAQLQVGDALTVGNQTRRITQIISEHEVVIDEPFCPDLPTATPFTSTLLFAGTSGGGTFRSNDKGETWTCVNTSSTSKEVTALGLWVHPNSEPLPEQPQNVVVGTAIGNILHSSDRGDRWTSVNSGLTNVDAAISIFTRLQPSFTSTDYGNPGYGQLSLSCPEEIRTGAEDGSEMGAFSYLKQPQREANLQMSLEEYLRFGLDAGIFYIN